MANARAAGVVKSDSSDAADGIVEADEDGAEQLGEWRSPMSLRLSSSTREKG